MLQRLAFGRFQHRLHDFCDSCCIKLSFSGRSAPFVSARTQPICAEDGQMTVSGIYNWLESQSTYDVRGGEWGRSNYDIIGCLFAKGSAQIAVLIPHSFAVYATMRTASRCLHAMG